MRVPTPLALSIAGFGALSIAVSGCSDDSSGRRTYLSTGTAAVTSDQVLGAAANGQIPGVPGLSDLAQGGMREGPGIEITSPARASVVRGSSVALSAKLTDIGRGVTDVKVNGMSATPAADNTIDVNVQLVPGANTLTVEATDVMGNRTERHVTVLAGDFAPENAPLARTGSVRITDTALDQAEPKITQEIESKRNDLIRQVLNTNMGKNTKAKGFRFGQVTSQIDAVPGGVDFAIDVANLELDFEVKVKILFVFKKTKRGTIRAQNLRITGHVGMGLDNNGQLTSTVQNVNAQVGGFSVPSFASDYRQKIHDAFVNGFKDQGTRQIRAAVTDLVGQTQTNGQSATTVLGQSLTAQWALTSLTFDDWGLTTVLGSHVRADAPSYGQNLPESWVVNTPVSDLVGAGPGWTGAVAVHQNALNQALHAAWRSGAMSMKLDSSTYSQLMPGQAPLTSDSFSSLYPGLSNFLPSGPVTMDIEAQLPPTVRVVSGQNHMLELSLNSVKVATTVTDPATGNVTNMGESYYSIVAEVSLQEVGGTVKMVPSGRLRFYVDIHGQALPGTEYVMEQISDSMATPMMNAVLNNTGGLPIPTFNGATFSGARFLTHQESIVAAGQVTLR